MNCVAFVNIIAVKTTDCVGAGITTATIVGAIAAFVDIVTGIPIAI